MGKKRNASKEKGDQNEEGKRKRRERELQVFLLRESASKYGENAYEDRTVTKRGTNGVDGPDFVVIIIIKVVHLLMLCV